MTASNLLTIVFAKVEDEIKPPKPWMRPPDLIGEINRRTGFTKPTLTSWLRGDTSPRFDDMVKLLDICGYRLEMNEK